jgi:hypothetical protein
MVYRIVIPVSLLVVLIISGCTLPPFDDNPKTGVVVEAFTTDFDEVYSGEIVQFTLKVRNIGSVKATGGFAEMLGIDQTWKGVEGTSINPSNQEVFPIEQNCRYTTQAISLLPPDPASGIEGGDYICTWKYVAPELQPGLYAEYNPRARFFYNYESFTTQMITLIPREELKSYQDQGKSLPVETKSRSDSPIQMDIKVQTPIRTYGSDIEFPVVIEINNVGDGTVCSDANHCKKYPYMSGQSTTEGPQWDTFDLTIETGQGLSLGTCRSTETIVLNKGESQAISCKITASIPDTISQRSITLRAEYGYFVDKTTHLRVLPAPIPE